MATCPPGQICPEETTDAAEGAVASADAGTTPEGTGVVDTGWSNDALGDAMAQILAGLYPAAEEDEYERTGAITGEAWDDYAFGIDQTPGEAWGEFTAGGDQRYWEGGVGRTPQYSVQDPLNVLNGMTSAQLASLELQFVEAGYIDEDAMLQGQRGPLIADFGTLMQQADHNRISWQDQLGQNITAYQTWREENPEEVPLTWAQRNPFIAPVEIKPDYATLAQGSKATMRQMLGRTPTSSEMKLLTAQLGADYHDEWQAEVFDTSRMSWEAASRAHEAEATSGATGSVQGIDPEARFAERFEDRYENELEHRERVDTSTRKSTNLFGSIDTISRMTS